MTRPTIHIWGFYDGETPRPPNGAAVCEGSVYDAFCTVVANITHFGGGVTERSTLRDLNGWLRGVKFDAPAHGDADLIWHQILEASDPWPDPTNTPTVKPDLAGTSEQE